METMESSPRQQESLPSLIRYISSVDVPGFDNTSTSNMMNQPSVSATTQGNETIIAFGNCSDESPQYSKQRTQSVSISMPCTPLGSISESTKRVFFEDDRNKFFTNSSAVEASPQTKQAKFYSQPMPMGVEHDQERVTNSVKHQSLKKFRDKRFDSFKTMSGKVERQLSYLRGKPHEEESSPENSGENKMQKESLPVDRYFDALEGPELENLRASEELVLPDDKRWPFLLRYPVSSFGICLGISSQAILWKTLATSTSTKFLHISPHVNLVLWIISLALVATVGTIYLLKLILYFEAVRREYYHPIRVNFFFAPWIALLFIAIGLPPSVSEELHSSLWYILMTPFLLLELKIYGQWMSGGQRRLSKVANPSNHLSIVGNFVGALLGASMGLKEGPLFFFAVGMAHYTVLFVTLYQRLPTNETLPKELHPVFFLFVAAPSVASMAWAKIQGSFDYGSRIAYFIALFLYFSLAVRINFFRGFKFSWSWWAYTFPMTGAAIATIRYSNEVTNVVTQTLAVTLSVVSSLTVAALLITTIIHAFWLRDLFPNDIVIAISVKKSKNTSHHHHHLKWFHRRHGSSENKEIENCLKDANLNNSAEREAPKEVPCPNGIY
ncbi:S-type anion channel SLAH2-like [Euphorbia lathyris]|uniref:S-type anion channel SLAH2-like n=1 Tax=Euphorbia lathyris TaxID=212925 RepID=UPI0033143C2D